MEEVKTVERWRKRCIVIDMNGKGDGDGGGGCG